MAIFDFLFGSSNPPPVTSTTQTNIPSYIAEPTADIIGEAMDVAKEGYVPYTGTRLAGFTPDELAAFEKVRKQQGIAGLQQQQAYTAATAAGAPAIGGVGQYMTDYQKQVADIAAREMREKSLQQQQDIAAKAVGAGGLDSSRFAILEAEREKALTQGLGDLYATAQAQAYETARAGRHEQHDQINSVHKETDETDTEARQETYDKTLQQALHCTYKAITSCHIDTRIQPSSRPS